MGGGDKAARKIAFAYRIIVNKVKLLGRHEPPPDHGNDGKCNANNGGYGWGGSCSAAAVMATVKSVMRWIERINPTAPARTTMLSRVDDLGWILDSDCFNADRARDIEAAFQRLSLSTTKIDDNNTEGLGRPCTNMYYMGNHRRPPPRDFDPYICRLCGRPVPTMIAAVYVIGTPTQSA